MIIETADKILNYWFKPDGKPDKKKWFINSYKYDDEIKVLFHDTIKLYENKKGIDWLINKKTFLAYIILMDQMSRHIYRNTSDAYKNDNKALLVAEMGIDIYLKELNGYEILFAFMPYSHTEKSFYYNRGDEIIRNIKNIHGSCNIITDKIERHYIGHKNIITTFGRFPKRNNILNRDTTLLEKTYLETVKNNYY
jgi:uncharacterized protein (DUF924 family)